MRGDGKNNRPSDDIGGRPTIYTESMGEYICQLVATHSWGLKKLCRMYPEIPHSVTIMRWRIQVPEFCRQYDKAKRQQAEALAEDCLDIADEVEDDLVEAQNGATKVNYENIQRSKLRIDTRKWMAEKLAPSSWGNQQRPDTTLTAIEQLLKASQEDK